VINIILVEDSLVVRRRLREILGDIGAFNILGEFDTAQDAIAAIQAEPPDAMLLDIKLRVATASRCCATRSSASPRLR